MDARHITLDGEALYGEEDELFLMTNVRPKDSGLPFFVHVMQNDGTVPHDVRVKVGQKAKSLPFRASVSVRPDVRVTAGDDLPTAELDALRRWIELNRDVILAHWSGEIDSSRDVLEALRPIEP